MKHIAAIILLCALAITACYTLNRKRPELLKEDPIAAYGHGSFVGQNGKNLEMTEQLIGQIQDYYIAMLSSRSLTAREGSTYTSEEDKRVKAGIYDIVDDKVLANAFYLDWLIEHTKHDDGGRYQVISNGLRWYYIHHFKKDALLPDEKGQWWKGISKQLAERLRKYGIVVYAITNAGIAEYCEECLDQGVPVPQNMFGSEWTSMGSFDGDEFISGTLDPNLLLKVSTNPPGFCLALPRYNGSNRAELFGVICMSYQTGKVCFFDNPNGTFYAKDVQINFRQNFLGGRDLVLNGQGECTDCHAGENPYVTHPEVAAFGNYIDAVGGNTMPPRWYIPIVDGTWRQNPGPTYLLDVVSSPSRCDACHMAGGNGGRFPRVSALDFYCTDVLQNAVARTMPPFGADPSRFTAHTQALTQSCGTRKNEGTVVNDPTPPANNGSVVSPPLVVDPIYECATVAGVKGSALDAKVQLFEGTNLIGTIDPARSPTLIEFTGLPGFINGQVITARQTLDGVTSDPSPTVIVRKISEDYPDGLPLPEIDPTTVYECANVIAVKHVPGAIFTIYTDGANPSSGSGSTGYTMGWPSGAPFTTAMKFTVEQSLCASKSGLTEPVSPVTAPSTLPSVAFDPNTIYVGQELLQLSSITYGAKVIITESTTPWNGSVQTPISWFPDYDIATRLGRPLQSGDNVSAVQELCGRVSVWDQPRSKLHDCERFPGCRIEAPRAGNSYVLPYDHLPGARIRVYDSGGNEIGDGSGTVINLTRTLVAGETISITHTIGECTSRFVFNIVVT